jgi:NitT/TauT family transport system substrate-binding protein
MKHILFSILSISLLLSACSGKEQENKNIPSLSVGVMSSMDYLPLAVAQREGYFTQHGVEVKIRKFMSANERDMAFLSGTVDGGVTDYTSAALLASGGFDTKLTSRCQAPFYIVAGAQSGINNLSELKGKKIAVSQNTVIDFCVDMALASVNLTPADVEKVEINKIPARFEMLRNNKIDATGLPNPFALIAAGDGCKLLVSVDSLKYTVTGMVFSQKAIDSKSEAIRKMYAAYNDGVAYLNTHTAADIKDILVKDFQFPEAVAGKVSIPAYTDAQPVASTDRDIMEVIKWLGEKNLLKADFKVENLINGQLTK